MPHRCSYAARLRSICETHGNCFEVAATLFFCCSWRSRTSPYSWMRRSRLNAASAGVSQSVPGHRDDQRTDAGYFSVASVSLQRAVAPSGHRR